MNAEDWNYEMHDLALRWREWFNTPFPRGLKGENIEGCELVLIDADIAMLVMSTVERGPLKPGGVKFLRGLLDQLDPALKVLTGPGLIYFGELASMAEAAIRLSESAPDR